MKSTRDGYGEMIVELAKKNKSIVALSADLTPSVRLENFKKKFPERFFQCGVAEANMIGMAAGLALDGKIPFVSSFAVFVPNRCLDHIRQSVCYTDANVKIVSTHAGVITGPDGATHQALEDIAVMRALPNMKVVVPCDFDQAKKAVKAITKTKGPVYVRLTRPKTPGLPKQSFKIGKANVLRKGKDVTIIACGPIVYEALEAGKKVNATVINCHTLDPIDKATIVKYAKKSKKIVTIEDHQIRGGLGGAIAELLGENHPVKLKRIGADGFGESGSPEELKKKFGLTVSNITRTCRLKK
ncbi:transketolase family protein [Candidatus Woesearchaeota archaeon]|nr:transketolase family protein [Candidatus Woesearchaeota archaeon]